MDTAPTVHVLREAVRAEVVGSFASYDLVRAGEVSGWVISEPTEMRRQRR
jgi:hypothetical protein